MQNISFANFAVKVRNQEWLNVNVFSNPCKDDLSLFCA